MDKSLKVGDRLCYVPDCQYSGSSQFAIVKSVWRKWAKIVDERGYDLGRIDIKTLSMDGSKYRSPGTCYRDKETYERFLATKDAWNDFFGSLSCSVPKGVSIDDINKAKSILHLKERE